MGVNYVKLSNGEEVVDLRGDTVSADVLLEGYTATNSKGEKIIGKRTNNADTVDGIHLVVSFAEATIDDKSVITFIY